MAELTAIVDNQPLQVRRPPVGLKTQVTNT